MKPWGVAVLGGGILGTAVAYWLSTRFDAPVAVLEQEAEVAEHGSGRNTGVIHRPFYLHPRRSWLFSRSALLSYDLWANYAKDRGLPWEVVGTLKVATRPEEMGQLDTYLKWAKENGMDEGEVDVLGPQEARALEPHVRCESALHAKKETAVDFGAFTKELRRDAEANGVRFLLGRRVVSLRSTGNGVEMEVEGSRPPHIARYLINCAGGAAVDVAHQLGSATEYTDLHFRGEYWRIDERMAHLASRNIYSVPRHPEFPFLDPHWIVRSSGVREIGPNAVPVAAPWTYHGFYDTLGDLFGKLWEPPVGNKARLVVSPTFLVLALEEALGSVSKALLATRIRKFLPKLKESMLVERGTAGIRSSVIDPRGTFVKEVLEVQGPASTHILNYNSPGATGAPAYTASLISRLGTRGYLDHLRERPQSLEKVWSFEKVVGGFD